MPDTPLTPWIRRFAVCFFLMIAVGVQAQPKPEQLLEPFQWRNIGPANMMGRISCLDGYDADWRVQLVGAASGGVWKTTNGGTTFEPIFDRYGSQSIGDVAFFQPDTSIIWVGTGEATNRNSVGWGDGIYKSSDGGKTFQHRGLRETYQISEIAPHPTDSNTVYVAAIGHLFAYTGERGLFKTTDGGKTWRKLTNGLPDDGKTGATVVVIHPENPDVVFVGMYERLRGPANMQSGGPNGGLFQSTDGGESWRKLTNGLPTGDTGQIDLDIYLNNPDVMVAYVEADENLPEGVPGGGIYRSDDGGASWTFQRKHFSRPTYHGRIRIHPANDSLIYIVSRDFQHSTDGGKTYKEGHPWQTDGGDDHDLWISPQNGDVMLMATDQGARMTIDGGASVLSFNNMAIGQYYAIGVDMQDPYWVYGGLQDNGGWAIPSNSRDPAGILTDHVTVINGGDGFHMQVDPTDWRIVYTTTHVGYFGRLNRATGERWFITPRPHTIVNFDAVYDPDFEGVPIDYTINPGDYWTWRSPPDPSINGASLPPQFRFNWNSPLVMSPSNPHTIYVGGNYVFKSVDQGETWRIISPDLTRNDPATRNSMNSGGLTKDVTGAENHHTIYTLDESSLNPGIVWVGTDDGRVHVTRDAGATWTDVSAAIPGVPDGIWVSRVEASKFDEATAYVTLDGHWIGDTNPYVYKTTDFGATWTDLAGTIPRETPGNSVYTIVEDHINPDLLFIGTEFGCFVSLDGGGRWHPFMNGLPPVAVHDLVIHPRTGDLVAGTHGRSIWIADDLAPLRQPNGFGKDVHLFDNPTGTRWRSFPKGRVQTHFLFRGENPPEGAAIHFYLKNPPPQDTLLIEITDLLGKRSTLLKTAARAGINTARWDMTFTPSVEEIDAHRADLRRMASEIGQVLGTYDNAEVLFHMQRDLIAPHRAPSLVEDAAYPNLDDARRLLLDHLSHLRIQLDEASELRDFARVRRQLVAYSSVVGDQAYFGFFGDELAAVEAEAGTYRVMLRVGGEVYSGTVSVREDPLLDGE